jgi:hypothetical protein
MLFLVKNLVIAGLGIIETITIITEKKNEIILIKIMPIIKMLFFIVGCSLSVEVIKNLFMALVIITAIAQYKYYAFRYEYFKYERRIWYIFALAICLC